jgi:hypothetical protein
MGKRDRVGVGFREELRAVLGEGSSSPAPATKSFLRVRVGVTRSGHCYEAVREAVRAKQSLLQ